MIRREFLSALAGGALAYGRPGRTNLVLILADDLGVNDLACYGNRFFATPNLDRLASQGAKFTSAYAACPVCSPTRASIMTGKYPVRTGVTDWIPGRPHDEKSALVTPRTGTQLKLEENTIPERLKPAGYTSAAIGKWHLGSRGFEPADQGFDLQSPAGPNAHKSPEEVPEKGPYDIRYFSNASKEYLTNRQTNAACAFIRENRDRPFFTYLAFNTVHIPVRSRAAGIERHTKIAGGRYNPIYADMVEHMDDAVGQVLDTIERAGLADNTAVAFMSDNGGLLFEGKSKERVTDNSPLRAGKGHLYEGGIRAPLLVRLPGAVKPGSLISTPVSSVDLLPTFCELAGRPAGAVDGVSLMPLLQGGRLRDRALFWHYPHYSNQGGEPGSAIRDGDWKLIRFYDKPRQELFNLAKDPGETRNLVERESLITRKLSAKLDAWLKDTAAIIPTRNPHADPAWPGWNLTGEQKPTPPVS